jgi:serine/threonine protein kinase
LEAEGGDTVVLQLKPKAAAAATSAAATLARPAASQPAATAAQEPDSTIVFQPRAAARQAPAAAPAQRGGGRDSGSDTDDLDASAGSDTDSGCISFKPRGKAAAAPAASALVQAQSRSIAAVSLAPAAAMAPPPPRASGRGGRAAAAAAPEFEGGGSAADGGQHAAAAGGSAGATPFDGLTASHEVVSVGGRQYLKLDCIGKGGSSRVYRVLAADMAVYALKRVRLSRMDAASVATYTNEIALLRRLSGARHIIRLVDAEVAYESRCIHMVMEYGQCDLNALLQQERERCEAAAAAAAEAEAAAASAASASAPASSALPPSSGLPFIDENVLRLVWQQMLQAVQTIHDTRIVHGDLKPANFVFVEGVLKLIDFGIAKAISNDTTNIVRDSQVGTLNYMSPEAILDVSRGGGGGGGGAGRAGVPTIKLGRPSDIWSLGCILYQMVYGRTPFADLTLIQKLHCIVDPHYEIAFPPTVGNAAVVDVIKACLHRDPAKRPPIAGPGGLLTHPFLRPNSAMLAPTQLSAPAASIAAAAAVAAPPSAAAGVSFGAAAFEQLFVGLHEAGLLMQDTRGASAVSQLASQLFARLEGAAGAAGGTLASAPAIHEAILAALAESDASEGSVASGASSGAASVRSAASQGMGAAAAAAAAAAGRAATKPAVPAIAAAKPVSTSSAGSGAALQQAIKAQAAALRPVQAVDKENKAPGGKAGTAGSGGGLEAVLRRGLSQKFAHAKAGDDTTDMDLTWNSNA